MIDKDFWQEVLQTIRQQKWRSLMTAFVIFWGLLMLMFLIGAGVGFQEGIVGQLKQMPANSAAYAIDATTIAYNGLERGRSWHIEFKDVEAIQAEYPGAVKQAVYVKFLPSVDSTLTVSSANATDELIDISTSSTATSVVRCASSVIRWQRRFSLMTNPLSDKASISQAPPTISLVLPRRRTTW